MTYENFDDFEISNLIKKSVREMGFVNTTPVQKLAIPEALKGNDITSKAQTGSGKTAAFSIPILNKIFIPDKSPQAIILCPTRELCLQISREITKMGSNIKKLKVLAVYGGQPIGKQIRVLKKGVHIVVGTPGRVIDHIGRGTLELYGIESVVLDEADEMLDMGFREDIELILRQTPRQRQTMLFSATMNREVRKIAKIYQINPKFIKVPETKINTPKIRQCYFKCSEQDKFDVLNRLLKIYDPKLSLIFCNTKKRVDFLVKQLKGEGYSADSLHGDMTQKIRDKVMNKFRNGNIGILVATDVAARGIDVLNIDMIVNFDTPKDKDYYVHRIGRTARAGRNGYAFSLVSKYDEYYFSQILKENRISKKNIPSLKEMDEIKNKLIMDNVMNSIKVDNLEDYVKVIKENSSKEVSSTEIAAGLLKMIREN